MTENDSNVTYPCVKSDNKPVSKLGSSAEPEIGRWVQTDRRSHEEWGKLAMTNPRAAGLLHHLVARMGTQNAVVASQKTLAEIMGCSLSTAIRAIKELKENNWIQVVQIGANASINAYVINDRVAWGQRRDLMPHTSVFSANIIASASEQPKGEIENKTELRKIPVLFKGESQLPVGEPADPPVQNPLIANDPPAIFRED